jgi:hypothetical protein
VEAFQASTSRGQVPMAVEVTRINEGILRILTGREGAQPRWGKGDVRDCPRPKREKGAKK